MLQWPLRSRHPLHQATCRRVLERLPSAVRSGTLPTHPVLVIPKNSARQMESSIRACVFPRLSTLSLHIASHCFPPHAVFEVMVDDEVQLLVSKARIPPPGVCATGSQLGFGPDGSAHSEWPRSVSEWPDIGQAGHLPVQCQDCQAVACVVVGDEAVEKAGAAGCFQSLDNGPPVHRCHQAAAQRLR